MDESEDRKKLDPVDPPAPAFLAREEDTDTQLRQRRGAAKKDQNIGKKGDKAVRKDEEEPKQSGCSNVMVVNLLPATTSLALCLLTGGLIRAFPDAFYPRLLAYSEDNPDGVWQLTEKAFVIVYVTAVVVLSFLLPVMALLTKRYRFRLPALINPGC